MADHELTKGEARQIVERYCHSVSSNESDWIDSSADCRGNLSSLGLDDVQLDDQEPITLVTHDQALLLAEMAGMRLMTEAEYLFAATNGGNTRYPWGDDETLIRGWDSKAQSYDVTQRFGGIHGLYSGVAEWTESRFFPLPGEPQIPPLDEQLLCRIVRGAPGDYVYRETIKDANAKIGPRYRFGHLRTLKDPRIGVRFCRSVNSP